MTFIYISFVRNIRTTTYDNNKLTTADTSLPTLQAHLHFSNAKAATKNAKESAIFKRHQPDMTMKNIGGTDLPAPNSMQAIAADSVLIWKFVILL
jgi:hypothetical protein